MSWDSYIDNLIAQSKDGGGQTHVDKACIIGLDGGARWTSDDHASALKVANLAGCCECIVCYLLSLGTANLLVFWETPVYFDRCALWGSLNHVVLKPFCVCRSFMVGRTCLGTIQVYASCHSRKMAGYPCCCWVLHSTHSCTIKGCFQQRACLCGGLVTCHATIGGSRTTDVCDTPVSLGGLVIATLNRKSYKRFDQVPSLPQTWLASVVYSFFRLCVL